MDLLEKKFESEMSNIYNRLKKELNYNASRFNQLIINKGGLIAAKELISKKNMSYGIETLWENNRLDLSVEALVLRPEYEKLFTNEERENCIKKLKDLNYNL